MDASSGKEQESAAERANRRVCALFDACRAAGTPRGRRDAALISVLYGAGLPRRRAVRLARAAYEEGRGRLDPRRTVGGTAGDAPGRVSCGRPLQATDGARRALEAWIRERGDRPGPLLCRLSAGSADPARPLEPGDVEDLLARWSEEAGVAAFDAAAVRELYDSPWWRTSCPD